jgi:hypothetical protein
MEETEKLKVQIAQLQADNRKRKARDEAYIGELRTYYRTHIKKLRTSIEKHKVHNEAYIEVVKAYIEEVKAYYKGYNEKLEAKAKLQDQAIHSYAQAAEACRPIVLDAIESKYA